MITAASRPLPKAIIALLCPGVAALVFYAGVRTHLTNNRVFDGLLTLPLAIGAYCGVVAFRSGSAHFATRALGLVAALVCVPYAAVMLFITIFGLR